MKLWDGIEVSNGLGFSPDRKHLYHSDSSTGAVWVYDVTHERGVKDRRIFAKMPEGMPDGLAVDAQGGVWVAAVRVGEVVHFSKDATVVKRIKLPATMVTSLVFGGRDLRDLYVVTADNTDDPNRKGTIFRGRADVPGTAGAESKLLVFQVFALDSGATTTGSAGNCSRDPASSAPAAIVSTNAPTRIEAAVELGRQSFAEHDHPADDWHDVRQRPRQRHRNYRARRMKRVLQHDDPDDVGDDHAIHVRIRVTIRKRE